MGSVRRTGNVRAVSDLVERLGYPSDARLVIITCDDFGVLHSSNAGCYRALRQGVGTTASLMVPAPWAREAAARYRGEDVGVHVTLNAEYDLLRWGPLTQAPSLLDGDGGFPRTLADLWDHADLEEVRRECRAQIERAIVWGFDVSHLSSHLNALTMRPEFFDIYLDLAVEFRLPLRLPSKPDEHDVGFPFRALAAEEGVVFPDHFVAARHAGSRERVERVLADLQPGVTELHVQPVIDTPEVRALSESWSAWVDDLDLVTAPEGLASLLPRTGAIAIGFRPLRDLMRR